MSATQTKITYEAADWVVRMHAADCSEADLLAMTDWMETSPAHAEAYATALVLWSERSEMRQAAPVGGFFVPAMRYIRSAASNRAGLAGLAAAIVAAMVMIPAFQTPATRYETEVGKSQEVTLSDGTDLSLNSNTRVSVRIDEHQRVLTLDHGVIAIDVGEKSDTPMTVIAGDIAITDIGAEASISRLNGIVRVTLRGDDGNDMLDGGSEHDTMYGGDGNDTYVVDHEGDRVFENADEGNDTVKAAIDYALSPDIESLTLIEGAVTGTGNGLVNNLNGSNLDNVLSGLGGDDNIFGWDGDDAILGGSGDDRLVGGAGADTFIFLSTAINGCDHIVDFAHGVDKLSFTGAAYGFAPGHVLTDEEFTIGSIAVGPSAQFVWNVAEHRLYFDADGDGEGQPVELAMIDNGAVVSKEDFLIS